MTTTRYLILAFVFGLGAASACKCGESPGAHGSDGAVGDGSEMGDGSGPGGDGSGFGDGSNIDAGALSTMDTGPGSTCTALHGACTRAGSNCCSGTCSSSGTCENATQCKMPNDTCTLGTECCTLNCTAGHCGSTLCHASGQACTTNADCCSTICGATHTCETLPPGPGADTCKTLGEACMVGSDCCSTNCQGGACVRAAACQANGDICHTNDDCCGHVCSGTGGQPGRCQFVAGGGGGGCLQDGNPCPNGGSNCCSRICVDLGSGVPVCQIAGGCRLTGDWCKSNQECCGGGSNPNGTVMCVGAPNGRCDNGQACNPTGNICGAPVLPDGGSINASQNCCDGRKDVCKVDSAGIPRCFGGCPGDMCGMMCPTGYDPTNPNCCLAAGQACQFQDQCCNRVPCVPGSNGTLVCAQPVTCQVVGDPCTPGAAPGPMGCCAGTQCLAAMPSGYACQVPLPPPDGGVIVVQDGGPVGDGGTHPDAAAADAAPACLANGQACSLGSMCCSGVCQTGMCEMPNACQPQGSACTATSDCCTGLSCAIPSGSTAGTCQPGSTCSAQGQACSTTQPCCSGLNCDQVGTFNACNGTTACTCTISL
jgi:hypothetical protein